MLAAEHEALAELFFRLIADHGRFNARQLHRFVELKTGIAPDKTARAALIRFAVERGAKREKCEAEVYAFRGRSRRRKRKAPEEQLAFEGPLGEVRPKPRRKRRAA